MLTNRQSLNEGNYIAYEKKIIGYIYFVVICSTILLSSLLLVSSIGSIISLIEDLVIETTQFFFFFFLGRIVQSVPLLSSKDESEYRTDSPPAAALAM